MIAVANLVGIEELIPGVSFFLRDEEQHTMQQVQSSQITNAVGDKKITSILDTKKDTNQAEIPEKMRSAMLGLYPDDIKVIDQLKHDQGEPIRNDRTCHFPTMKLPKDDMVGAEHLPSRCCIGAVSAGAHQMYFGYRNDTCIQNITAYEKARDLAIDALNSSPIHVAQHLECDLCRIIQIVSTLKHRRISIVGDSIQRQLFNGLECELFRRGFNVSEWKVEQWKDEPRPNCSGWRYGMKGQQCFNVSVPEWMTKTEAKGLQVEVCNFEHYRPYPDMIQHKQIVNSTDLMVIDYGLHYLSDEGEFSEYEKTLNGLMEVVKDAPGCHLVYRETSAQHFDNQGGDFSRFDLAKSNRCVPHEGSSSLLRGLPERSQVLLRAARSQNYTVSDPYGSPMVSSPPQSKEGELTFLPFWNYTSKFAFLHGFSGDCTHFCYTPHFWYMTWRDLRNTLDRLASKNKTWTSPGGDVVQAGNLISSRDEKQITKQQIPSSQITNAV